MKIEAGKIKSWVERVERLLEERAGINGDIKDIYAEIKSNEHDAKAIRKLIQRRAMDPADLALQDDLLTAYTDAVAGKIRALDAISKGASTKEAAKAGGISTGSVSALASVQKSRIVNEPETGSATVVATGNLDALSPDSVPAGQDDSTITSHEQEALAAGEGLGSPQWQVDCLKWRGRVLTGKYGHWCPAWDDLPIDETSLEWPCACAPPEELQPHGLTEEEMNPKDEIGAGGSLQGDRVAAPESDGLEIPAFLRRVPG